MPASCQARFQVLCLQRPTPQQQPGGNARRSEKHPPSFSLCPSPIAPSPLGLDTNNMRGVGSSPNPFNVLRRTCTGKGASKTADLQCKYHLQPGQSFVICLPFSLNAAVRQQLQLLEEGSYLLTHLMSSEDICTHISLPFVYQALFPPIL